MVFIQTSMASVNILLEPKTFSDRDPEN